jgi:hypothetical protein
MKPDPKMKLEAVRTAMQELGPAPPELVSAFVARRFGLDIPPEVIPLFRATIEDRDRLDARRSAAGRPATESGSPSD